MDQDELIPQAKAGDQNATSKLFFRHYDYLHQFLTARIPFRHRTSITPEDVLQETVIDACLDINTANLQSEEGFIRWLTTIAEHRLLDAIDREETLKRGREWRRMPNEVEGASGGLIDLLNEIACDTKSPSQKFSLNELRAALASHLERLPPHYREVIDLRFGLSDGKPLGPQEIAAQTGRTVGQTSMNLSRGLKKLRDAMDDLSP